MRMKRRRYRVPVRRSYLVPVLGVVVAALSLAAFGLAKSRAASGPAYGGTFAVSEGDEVSVQRTVWCILPSVVTPKPSTPAARVPRGQSAQIEQPTTQSAPSAASPSPSPALELTYSADSAFEANEQQAFADTSAEPSRWRATPSAPSSASPTNSLAGSGTGSRSGVGGGGGAAGPGASPSASGGNSQSAGSAGAARSGLTRVRAQVRLERQRRQSWAIQVAALTDMRLASMPLQVCLTRDRLRDSLSAMPTPTRTRRSLTRRPTAPSRQASHRAARLLGLASNSRFRCRNLRVSSCWAAGWC